MTIWIFSQATLAIAIYLSIIVAVAWAVRRQTNNSGWVDAVWTFGLGIVGLASALIVLPGSEDWTSRQIIVAILIALWSLRLGAHIAQRNLVIEDDPRYAALAKEWGTEASQRMFWLLQKQALVTIPLALSVFLAAHNPVSELRLQDTLAILIAVIAIIGEGIADRQLRQFKSRSDAASGVCDKGLWGWSRHPNYFFEWFGWLAYPIFAIDLSGAYPWGWLALAGPLCMYLLLRHVSGIPPLEKHLIQSRGDAYRAYQNRTSAFFPLPAKSPG
jgi:steroid 5-alpha reductase family enzyme